MSGLADDELFYARVLYEEKRRKEYRRHVWSLSFDAQRNFCLDPSRLKAALCSRRAGKSSGASLGFLDIAYTEPGSNMLYIGLTEKSAINILWKDCLATQAKRLKKSVKLNEDKKRIKFGGTSSILYYAGVDTDKSELEKLLGNKYRRIVIDEAASYSIDLKALIYQYLMPATEDVDGDIWLIGTPGNRIKSYFHRVTTGLEPEWSVHKWTALDNPHMRDKWLAAMNRLKEKTPGIEETPWFQQMYLGMWAIDESALVYKFKRAKNLFSKLPDGKWRFVHGIDLGHSPDPTAFVVQAYRDYDPKLYTVFAYKRTEMNISDVADFSKQLDKRFPSSRQIIDGSNKQAVAEMRDRHKMHKLETAEKTAKVEFINLMNNDFAIGNIMLHEEEAKPLQDEYESHIWEERAREKGKFVEDPKTANHCCDGGLYSWRYCLNWVDRGLEPDPDISIDKKMDDYWAREAERLQAREQRDWYDNYDEG